MTREKREEYRTQMLASEERARQYRETGARCRTPELAAVWEGLARLSEDTARLYRELLQP